MSSFRRPIARLPDTGKGSESITIPQFPARRGGNTEIQQKWDRVFGRNESAGSHGLMRTKMVATGSEGLVRLPMIEDWVSARAEGAENFAFFNDPVAVLGIDEQMWPAELARNLGKEDSLARSLMGERAGKGSYLKLGCKNGNDLAAACGVFSNIYALDVSIEMLKASARAVAERLGQEGVDKLTLIRGDMADDIRPIRPQSIAFATCGFNHFGNLGRQRQILFLKQAHRFMRHSANGIDKEEAFPLLLTVYREHERTARMQREFCANMGLEIITSAEDEEKGFVAARTPGGNVMRSERFTPEKVDRIIAKANSCLVDNPIRVLQRIDISETMMALVLYVQRTKADDLADGTFVNDLDAPINRF